MKEKIWAYMLKLSTNMWGDKGSTWTYAPYEEKLNTDIKVWREIVNFLPSQGINTVLIDVGDAIEYETHPEVSIKGAWSKEMMKTELDHIRSLGMTPIPKLNFSTAHDAWLGVYSRMVSTPQYYQVCKDLIKEVAEVFENPPYFHLGMDEETSQSQRALSYCCVRQGELFWHDVYFLFDICEKLGIRPWVFADMYWEKRDEYIEKMPKSVLQSNWAYGGAHKNPDGSYKNIDYQTYEILDKAGFEQIPCCSTFNHWFNSKETMELGTKCLNPERVKGYLMAPWEFTRPYALYMLYNAAYQFGNAKKEYYPKEK